MTTKIISLSNCSRGGESSGWVRMGPFTVHKNNFGAANSFFKNALGLFQVYSLNVVNLS